MAESVAELRVLPTTELIRRHDQMVRTMSANVSFYLEELARRDAVEQGNKMLRYAEDTVRLTKCITLMTVIMTLATVVNVAVFVLALR